MPKYKNFKFTEDISFSLIFIILLAILTMFSYLLIGFGIFKLISIEDVLSYRIAIFVAGSFVMITSLIGFAKLLENI